MSDILFGNNNKAIIKKLAKYNMERLVGTQANALVQGLSAEQFEKLKNNSMYNLSES